MTKNSLKAALATGGALVGAGVGAQASIIFTDLATPVTGQDVYFSLAGQTASNSDSTGAEFQIYGGDNSKKVGGQPAIGALDGIAVVTGPIGLQASNLSLGDVVGPSDNISRSAKMNLNFSSRGQKGYVGLVLALPSEPGQFDYGWAEVSLNSNRNKATVYEFAYDDSGAPIEIGAVPVPEPSNVPLAILLTGTAATVMLARKRRLQAANSVS